MLQIQLLTSVFEILSLNSVANLSCITVITWCKISNPILKVFWNQGHWPHHLNVNVLICRQILTSAGVQELFVHAICACKFCFLHFLQSNVVTGSLCSLPVCCCLHRTKVTFVTVVWPLTVEAVTPQSLYTGPTQQNLSFHTRSVFVLAVESIIWTWFDERWVENTLQTFSLWTCSEQTECRLDENDASLFEPPWWIQWVYSMWEDSQTFQVLTLINPKY